MSAAGWYLRAVAATEQQLTAATGNDGIFSGCGVHSLDVNDPFEGEPFDDMEDQLVRASTDEDDATTTRYSALMEHNTLLVQQVEHREWVATHEAERRAQKKKTARMAVKMDIDFATETLIHKVREARLYNELFVYIPFIIAFVFLYITNASTEQAYYANAQLGGHLRHARVPPLESYTWTLSPYMPEGYHVSFSFDSIRCAQDWHFWFETEVMSFLWGAADPNERVLANSFVHGSNIKFGALRIRALKMNNGTCTASPPSFNLSNVQSAGLPDPQLSGACYATYSTSGLNTSDDGTSTYPQLLRFIDCTAASQLVVYGWASTYPCVGQSLEIPVMWSRNEALAQYEKLRGKIGGGLGTLSGADVATGYVTDDLLIQPMSTRAVIAEFFTYLPYIDQFQSYRILLEITAGGRFVHSVQVTTFCVWSMQGFLNAFTTVYFFFFYTFVMYYIFRYVVAFLESLQRGALLEFLVDFWNAMDVVNLLCFIAVLICRVVWMRESAMVQPTELLTATSYVDRLDYIALLYSIQTWLNALNTVISFLKVLKFVDLNPTLNIVTRTISRAQQSLVGVMVIFVIVVVSYAICGVAIFSNGVNDYRDVSTALSTLLRILIGDFDYVALQNESRIAAPLFFWSFVIVALFLLLNFIIGIILKAFEDESRAMKADTIPVLVRRLIRGLLATVAEFYTDPKAYMTARRERRAHRFAFQSRIATVIEQLIQYRIMLIINNYTVAELEHMTEEELRSVLPNETISRFDMERIFEFADPIEGSERAAWVGPKYFDSIWELCVQNYRVHRREETEHETVQLGKELESAAEDALAFVLGLGDGRGSDVSLSTAKPLLGVGEDSPNDSIIAAQTTGSQRMLAAAHAAYRREHARRERLIAVRHFFGPRSHDDREDVERISDVLARARREAAVTLRSVLCHTASSCRGYDDAVRLLPVSGDVASSSDGSCGELIPLHVREGSVTTQHTHTTK